MNTVILYKSKTGYTKKYAQWISEELSADIFDASNFNKKELKNYDIIVYGGAIYGGAVNGFKKIKKEIKKYPEKRAVVFATGASPFSEKAYKEIKAKNIKDEEEKQFQFFYLRGGFNFNGLGFWQKKAMLLYKKMIERKDPLKLTEDEKGLLSSYDNPVDFTKKENIKEILDYVCNLTADS
jgi:menaquinone-dependent protoporphyrinogen IX oxidase